MSDYSDGQQIQREVVGEQQRLTSAALGRRLAALRRARGLTQREVAERMKITKARVSHIEQGKVANQEVVARYAEALGGRLHQAIYFEDGAVAAIA